MVILLWEEFYYKAACLRCNTLLYNFTFRKSVRASIKSPSTSEKRCQNLLTQKHYINNPTHLLYASSG